MVRERAPDRASALPEECATDPEGVALAASTTPSTPCPKG